MANQEETLLFVYGSLRQQVKHPMHQVLARYGVYIGIATFQGRLYDVGRYPGVVASMTKSDRVIGEIYKLRRHTETFEILDDYEGPLFSRQQVTIRLETGAAVTSWIYLYRGAVDKSGRILSGDYLAYLNRL